MSLELFQHVEIICKQNKMYFKWTILKVKRKANKKVNLGPLGPIDKRLPSIQRQNTTVTVSAEVLEDQEVVSRTGSTMIKRYQRNFGG